MIGEMQGIIVNIMHRRLPYAPYLIHLFDKKGWLEDDMRNAFDQRLKPYKALKPDDKRRLRNKSLQPVNSCMARKPDGRRRVETRSEVEVVFDDNDHAHLDRTPSPSLVTTNKEDDDPPMVPCSRVSLARKPDGTSRVGTKSEMEAVFDDDDHARLDRTLSPCLEEQTPVVTTNEEDDPDDDPHMVPSPVLGEFRFSQQGAHDAEAGGSGCHADVPTMLQSQVECQTAILEQIQGQHERDLQQIQKQLAEFQRQSESGHQQLQGQLAELQQ
jgi:hypothetical protein